jgi:outer membrane autotransporter protein
MRIFFTLPITLLALAASQSSSFAAAPRPKFVDVVTIGQQAGFQAGLPNSGSFDAVLNQNTLDGGVTTGQGDGPGDQVIRTSSGEERWTAFTGFNFNSLDVEGFTGIQLRTSSYNAGVLYRLTPNIRIGASIGGVHSRGDIASGGNTSSDGLALGAYAVGNWGDNFIDLLYSATLLSNDITRTPLGTNASGSADSETHAISATFGRNMRFGRWVTGPRIGLDYAHWSMDSYTETGPGAVAFGQQSANSLVARADWFTSYDIKTSSGTVTPYAIAGWHRETMSGNPNNAGPGFIAGTDRVRHYMVAGTGLTWSLPCGGKLNAGYTGQFFGGAYQVHNISAMLAWSF